MLFSPPYNGRHEVAADELDSLPPFHRPTDSLNRRYTIRDEPQGADVDVAAEAAAAADDDGTVSSSSSRSSTKTTDVGEMAVGRRPRGRKDVVLRKGLRSAAK